jgi:cold shock CspA family protein
MRQQQGTVTSFDNNTGWIAPVSGGSPVFVHSNDIMGPMPSGAAPQPDVIWTLEAGGFVEYDTVLGARGMFAARVRILQEAVRGDLALPDRPLP